MLLAPTISFAPRVQIADCSPSFGLRFVGRLNSAWTQLPSVAVRYPNVFRGIDIRFEPNVAAKYAPGKTVTWYQFSSCSRSQKAAATFFHGYDVDQEWSAFTAPGTLSGTLFIIDVANGKAIADYSAYPEEEEVLITYNTFLTVVEVLRTSEQKRRKLNELARPAHVVRVWQNLGAIRPSTGTQFMHGGVEAHLAERTEDQFIHFSDDVWREFGAARMERVTFGSYVLANGHAFRPVDESLAREGVDLSNVDIYVLRQR